MKRYFLILLVASAVAFSATAQAGAHKKTNARASAAAHHGSKHKVKNAAPSRLAKSGLARLDPAQSGLAEARLIEVYQLAAKAQMPEALAKAESLVRDFPHFQLAQLTYGDLLGARARPIKKLGDVPEPMLKLGTPALAELLGESQMRLKGLRERPPSGAVPSQFLALSASNRHAIAVDASRSRLYLFENRPTGLTLVADYYVSIGKSGLEKNTEGDLRTPPGQFSRAPQATDSCVVLANPDLSHVIRTVEVRTMPVVISEQLNWVMPNSARSESKPFETALTAWQSAKSSGNMDPVLNFYSPDFNSNGKTLSQWTPALRSELDKMQGRAIALKDLSLLRWTDSADTMVVTFGEVAQGVRAGPTKRQYGVRQGSQSKIFYEGVIG